MSATHRTTARGPASRLASLASLPLLLLPLACSGGGSGSGRFTLVSTNGLENDSVWQINRPIELTFSQPVDLATANRNSVQITTVNGSVPAVGRFHLKAGSGGKTLVFQPLCPTNSALDDGGLVPRGVRYRLTLPTAGSHEGSSLRSQSGHALSLGGTREFTTPLAQLEFFLDPRPQAAPLVTKIYLGSRQVFPDPLTGAPPLRASEIGLNTFSDPIAPILILFDQPLNPSAGNLSADNIRLFYRDPNLVEVAIPTLVTLVENCGIEGSTLMLSPQGILPADTELFLLIKREMQDLVGETNLADIQPMRFRVQPSLQTVTDAFLEEFEDESYLDPDALFAEPRARWSENGRLEPATAFEGTNTSFIWEIDREVVIDTDFDVITGSNGTETIPVTNGIVDIKRLDIKSNGVLRAQGSNPLVILCSENAIVDGRLLVNGSGAATVATVCTTAIPEPGAPGICGGGSGGTGSHQTTTSTAQGGPGNGPFEVLGAGGQGGESGVGSSRPEHRPGGGGGGTWRPGLCIASPPPNRDEFGRCGKDGPPTSKDALGNYPAQGGMHGPAILPDGDPGNDFYGIRVDESTGQIVFGELPAIQGGQGGGAGGDAVQWQSFPSPNWNSGGLSNQICDLKGAGGGGGAGAVVIKALGTVRVSGEISAVGGSGAYGESVYLTQRVGGGSGAGAGGHIVLMAATSMDLSGAAIDASGGVGGNGGDDKPYSDPTSVSAGGHGGAGVIQYHVPDPSTNLTYTGANPPGTPAPVVLIPDFGAISMAQTRWITTGFSKPGSGTLVDPPEYWFQGIETSGQDAGLIRRTSSGRVEHPARHFETYRVRRESFAPHSVILPSHVAEVTNPGLLLHWELGDETALASGGSAPFFTIVSARYENGQTVIGTDPADGDLTQRLRFEPDPANPSERWAVVSLWPRYFGLATDGVEDSYPASVGVFILFQGADAREDDPSSPDLSTLVPDPNAPNLFTADVAQLAGKRFFRVRFRFNLGFDDSPLSGNTPRGSLDFFKLPFRF